MKKYFKNNLVILNPKISKKRVKSFWYEGLIIAELKLTNGNTLILETLGAIEVVFEENGTKFVGSNAVIEGYNLKLKDKGIRKLLRNDAFGFSNWFQVTELSPSGDEVNEWDCPIYDTYDEGMKGLKAVYKEFYK